MRRNWVVELLPGGWAVACCVTTLGHLYSVSRPVQGPLWAVRLVIRRANREVPRSAVGCVGPFRVATRKRRPWNADKLLFPELLGEPQPPPQPLPDTVTVGHSTPAEPEKKRDPESTAGPR